MSGAKKQSVYGEVHPGAVILKSVRVGLTRHAGYSIRESEYDPAEWKWYRGSSPSEDTAVLLYERSMKDEQRGISVCPSL